MFFQLTDEQRALQDAVRSYLRDRFGPAQVRDLYEHPETDGVPTALWSALGEQGWLAVLELLGNEIDATLHVGGGLAVLGTE